MSEDNKTTTSELDENELARLQLLESLPRDLEQARKIRNSFSARGISQWREWDIGTLDYAIFVMEETLRLARGEASS